MPAGVKPARDADGEDDEDDEGDGDQPRKM
jgi:hypothetical protein